MENQRMVENEQTIPRNPVTRIIGKYNTHVIVLDDERDVKLWDWTLMNAIKAEDDNTQQLLNAFNGGSYKRSSSEMLHCSRNQKANARCVALLQSSISTRGLHLIMDLQDVYTMRRRLIDVYDNLHRREEDNPVLLLLQFQQNNRSLKDYVLEMKRRIEVCKMFNVHLTLREQILAVIEGLNSTFTASGKNALLTELLKRSEDLPCQEIGDELENFLRCLTEKETKMKK